MAEMTKKLHFLKGGTEQTAKAYSTTAEAGSNYITNDIDNTTCYIPIGATDDAQATIGRITKGGTTYAIKSQAKPAYTEQSWTTPGTYTWTAPAGVTRVRVAVCGGGGGGTNSDYDKQNPQSGDTSKFGSLIQATGGNGARRTGVYDDSDNYTLDSEPGSGGSPNGRNGSKDRRNGSGGQGFALSFSLTNNSYGSGGTASSGTPMNTASGGGSGGYNTNYVNVSPGSSYSIVVGAGGYGLDANNKKTFYGNSGFVLIAYGGDI